MNEQLPISNSDQENRKDSFVNRYIAPTDKDISELKDFEDENFIDQIELQNYSRPKTSEESEFLSQLKELLQEFIADYCGTFYDIPDSNIHFIDESKISNENLEELMNNSAAIFSTLTQAIIISPRAQNSKIYMMNAIVHEMLHAQSFHSVQREYIENNDNSGHIKLDRVRRSGLKIRGSLHDKAEEIPIYLADLDEAVVEELTKRFDEKHASQIQFIQDEYKERNDLRKKIKDKVLDFELQRGNSEDEVDGDIAEIQSSKDGSYQGDPLEIPLSRYDYANKRKYLKDFISDVYEKNKNEYSSEDEVFKVFTHSMFTGKILDLARLIEKTFGKGSFREIAEETDNKIEE